MTDRLVIMNKGVIEQIGAPKDVYDSPASVFVASFIGAPGLNLLQGTVSADGEAVSLADGQRLTVDMVRYPALRPGPVVVGIRAEALTIRSQVAMSGASMKASFDFAEELGVGQHIHAEIAGQPLIIHVDGRHPHRPGAALGIDVSPQDLQLFDAETGLRIAEVESVIRITEAA